MQPDLVDSINPAYHHRAAGLLRQDPSKYASRLDLIRKIPFAAWTEDIDSRYRWISN